LEVLKRASCGLSSVTLKRTGCDVWQLVCQACSVIASVQSDYLLRGYMLPVLFDTDQSHSTSRCVEIQPMSQQAAAASRNMSVSIHPLPCSVPQTVASPRGGLGWTTPLTVEVAPEIDKIRRVFTRGRVWGSVRLQTPVGSRSALAMSVHPTYFDLATPLVPYAVLRLCRL